MINKQRLIKLTQALIRISSENPPGNEAQIAGFVQDYLRRLGVKTKIYEFAKCRANVVAEINGSNKKFSLLVTPHLDTVPRGRNWHFPPFAARIKKGRIFGLGASDCKCNIAISLEAIKSLFEEGKALDYNLLFAATADEESGSGLGLALLMDKNILKPDAVLVLDSDDFNIIVTQKGLMHLKVKIIGKRAHGAYPWQGVNAIEKAVEIIHDLKREKFIYRKNKYLNEPTINVGTIKGGDKVNIVADWVEFELDFRFLPGARAQDLLRRLKTIIKKHTDKFQIEIEGIQEPYCISETHPLVTQLRHAMIKSRTRPVLKGSEGATVISFFQQKKIPAVAWGAGVGGCAHTQDEYVKIDNLHKGAKILEYFLKNYRFSHN